MLLLLLRTRTAARTASIAVAAVAVAAAAAAVAVAAASTAPVAQAYGGNGTAAFVFGSYGSGDGQFDGPSFVAVGPSGRIAVSDTGNGRVQVFDPNGTFAFKFGSNGSGDGQFARLGGIDIGPSGMIAVADTDNHRVQVFDPNGTFAFKFGSYGGGGDAGNGSSSGSDSGGQLAWPVDVAVAPSGRIAVVDFNHSVSVFHPNGTFAFKFRSHGGGGGGVDGQFAWPGGIDVGPSGMIAVADTGNDRIWMFHPNGTLALELGSGIHGNGSLAWPSDVAVAPSGRIVVTLDNPAYTHSIVDARSVKAFHPNGTFDYGFGHRGSGDGDFDRPYGIAVGPSGRIAVADTGNNRIHILGIVPAAYVDYRPPPPPPPPPAAAQPPPPSVTGVTSPNADGLYAAGDEITIAVAFNRNVTVAAPLYLRLNTGAAAVYASGNGTSELVFLYTVRPGDVAADLDYADAAALLRPNATDASGGGGNSTGAADAAGNAADLWLPPPGAPRSLSYSAGIAIDARAPSVAGVSSPSPNATLRAGEQVAVHVRFDEPVQVLAARGQPPFLLLELGNGSAEAATARPAPYSGGNGTDTLSFLYAARSGDYADDLSYAGRDALSPGGFLVRDAAGNPAVLALPAPGSPGSLSHGADIRVRAHSAAVVDGAPPPTHTPPAARAAPAAEPGAIAVADRGNGRIQVFHPNGTFSFEFGSNGTGGARLDGPAGVAFGPSGEIAVSDRGGNRALLFHPNGTLALEIGPTGADGARLDGPAGVAFGPSGEIAVADYYSDRVRVFHPNGTPSLGFGSYGADGGQFYRPADVAFTPSGMMAAADYRNDRIQVFHPNGTFSFEFGSNGTGGAQLAGPAAVAVDGSGMIAVADDIDHRVLVFHPDGAFAHAFGTVGTGRGQFAQPAGVAFSPSGMMAVADYRNDRIQVFHPNGTFSFEFGSNGTGDGQFDGPLAVAYYAGPGPEPPFSGPAMQPVMTIDGAIRYPHGLAVSPADQSLYVMADTLYRVSGLASGGGNYSVEGWPVGGGPGEFDRPHGAAVAPDGRLHVADYQNRRIQTLGADGSPGPAISTWSDAAGGDRWYPYDVAAGGGGGGGSILAVGMDRFYRYDRNGTLEAKLGGGGGYAIATDASGKAYVLGDDGRISVWHANGTLDRAFGGGERGGSADGQFRELYNYGIAVAPDGRIVASDRGNHRVQVFYPNGTHALSFGSHGTDAGQFRNPEGIALLDGGRLAVADHGNHRVQVFELPGWDGGSAPPAAHPAGGANASGGPAADGAAPRVRGVSAAVPDGVYTTGDTVRITVEFDEPVEYSGSDPPRLALGIGAPPRPALYESGNGTDAMTFAYAVRAGDRTDDLGYAGTNALSGGIAGLAGSAANLTLPAPGSSGSLSRSSDVLIDHAVPRLVAAGSARDNTGGFGSLSYSRDIDTIVVGNRTYAAVASYGDHAVQLMRVHENGTLEAAGEARHGQDGFDRLLWPFGIDAFMMGNAAYAIVSSDYYDGVQLVRIHENGTLQAADSLDYDTRTMILGAYGIAAFDVGGVPHALAASVSNDGVQLVRIHANGTLELRGSLADDADLELYGAYGIAAFDVGGVPHALVAGYHDDGVQLIRIHANGTLEPLGSLADDAVLELDGPRDIAAFDMGGVPHVLVVSESDNGVQLVRVHANGTLEPLGSATNGARGFDELDGAFDVAAFELGGSAYAAIASGWEMDGGVQLVRIRAGDGALFAAGSASNTTAGFAELHGAFGIHAFDMGGRTYALAASFYGSAVQLFEISPASIVRVDSATTGGLHRSGAEIDITMTFDAPVRVVEGGKAPVLDLNSGGTAVYVSGSGTADLAFRYTVEEGDSAADLDYAGANALSGGATITHAATGLLASLVLPPPGTANSLGGLRDIAVDARPPSVASVAPASADGTYGIGSMVSMAVIFDEPVTYSGAAPELHLNVSGTMRPATYASGNGTAEMAFAYTVRAGDRTDDLGYADTHALYGSIADLAGNAASLALPEPGAPGSLSHSASIAVDGVRPAVAGVSASNASAVLLAGDSVHIHVRFTEPVAVAAAPGWPSLLLAAGGNGTDRPAPYSGGNGTATLSFLYAAQIGDYADDLSYAGTGALSPGGSTVRDAAGNPADLALPAPGSPGSLSHGADVRVRAHHVAVDDTPPPPPPPAISAAPGMIAVSDYNNHRVQVFHPNGTFALKFGSNGAGDGQFSTPRDVAFAPSGAVAVADTGNHRVQVFHPNGTFALKFGSNGTGDGQLVFPQGVAVGPSGRIAVADTGNHRVQVFHPNGTFALKFGSNGTGDGQLVFPQGVAVGPSGRIAVADYDSNRVQVFHPNGAFAYKLWSDNMLYDIGNRIPDMPSDVAFGPSGQIAVLDTIQNRVLVFHPNGTLASEIYGSDRDRDAHGDWEFDEPAGIAVGPSGAVAVADQTYDRILVLRPDGTPVLKFGSRGAGDGQFEWPEGIDFYAGPGPEPPLSGPAMQPVMTIDGAIRYPHGLAVSPADQSLYVMADTLYRVSGLASGGGNYSIEGWPVGGGPGEFDRPHGAAVAPDGRLHVADYQNRRIQTLGADGSPGPAISTWSDAAAGDRWYPYDVAAGSGGGSILAVGMDRFYRYDRNGTLEVRLGGGGGYAIATDSSGKAYVLGDDGRISVWHANGTLDRAFGGGERGGSADGQFRELYNYGIAVAPDGRIVASDRGNHRVQVFYPNGTHALSFGSHGTDAGQFRNPEGIALLDGGRLAVADHGNHRVQVFELPGWDGGGAAAPPSAGAQPGAAVLAVTSASPDGLYGAGDTIGLSVAFARAVIVSGGAPFLALEPGGRSAAYAGGSGTPSLAFSYTVQPGDSAARLAYAGTSALAPNGSSILDESENAAALALPEPGAPGSLSHSASIAVDGVRPAVAGVSASNASAVLLAGDSVHIHVRFSEPVTVTAAPGGPALVLAVGGGDAGAPGRGGGGPGGGGGDAGAPGAGQGGKGGPGGAGGGGAAARAAPYSGGNGTATLSFLYTAQIGDYSDGLSYAGRDALSPNGAAVRDAAGNPADLALPEPGSPGSLSHGADVRVRAHPVAVDDTPPPPPPPPATDDQPPPPPPPPPPAATSVSSTPAAAAYRAGQAVEIFVHFDRPVRVDASLGAPALVLETGRVGASGSGAPAAAAQYAGGSGTATLAFRYAVQNGDRAADLSYAGTDALSLNGSLITGTAGGSAAPAAVLSLPYPGKPGSLSHSADIVLDTDAPAVAGVSASAGNGSGGAVGAGGSVSIGVLFDEPVHVAAAPDGRGPSLLLALGDSGDGRAALYSGGNGTRTISFLYTAQIGDYSDGLSYAGRDALSPNGAAVRDAAGNPANLTLPEPGSPGSLSHGADVRVRAHPVAVDDPPPPPPPPPAVTGVRAPGPDGGYAAGSRLEIAVSFSEPVTVKGRAYLILNAAPAGSGGAGGPHAPLPPPAGPAVPAASSDADASARHAEYASGNNTATLVFAYVVQDGDGTGDLSYAGTGALQVGQGGAITAASYAGRPSQGGSGGPGAPPSPPAALPANTTLPVPGAPGSLSGSADIAIDTARPVVGIGLLAEAGPAGLPTPASQAIVQGALAGAAAFNMLDAGAAAVPMLNITVHPVEPPLHAGAYRAIAAAHALGPGPAAYIGPAGDVAMHAVQSYARANGLVVVSPASSDPSLAAAGDGVFRLAPDGRHASDVISKMVADADAGAAVLLVENDVHWQYVSAVQSQEGAAAAAAAGAAQPPPLAAAHGLPAVLHDDLVAYGVDMPAEAVRFGSSSGNGSQGADWAAVASRLAAAVGASSSPPGGTAVVYLGSPESLALLAPHLLEAGLAGGTAGWFAAGGVLEAPEFAAGAGSDAAAAAAVEFARESRLASIAFDVEPTEAGASIDSILGERGIAASRADRVAAYAAHDAAVLLGMSLARGGGPTADGVGRAAEEVHAGALGDIALDAAGDLRVPSTFAVWRAEPGAGPSRQPWLEPGLRTCSIALERAFLDFGSVPLDAPSRPVGQAIINTGTEAYSGVRLAASPWTAIAAAGGAAPPDPYTLPASITQMRFAGGYFEPLDSEITVAAGLPYDGQFGLEMRLDLRGHAVPAGSQMQQTVRYVVSC